MAAAAAGDDAEDEREATVLLCVDGVVVREVKGQQKTELDRGEMTVFRVPATQEELEHLASLGLAEGGVGAGGGQVVFVVCGEHKVPLTRRIPVLRKEPLQYTFVIPGLFLEMALPPDTDPEEIEVLEALLSDYASLRIKGQPAAAARAVAVTADGGDPGATVADRVGAGIEKAGAMLVGGIQRVTPAVQSGVTAASGAVQERVGQREEAATIDEQTADNIRRTRLVTRNAVIISGQLASAMVGVATQLGKQLATVAGSTSAGQRSGAGENENVEEVKKVALAGAGAAAQVMDAGQTAVKAVLRTTVDGLSDVIGHRYGDDAGAAARDGLGIATDVVEAGMNVRSMGVKGLAKKVGKEAAKEIVSGGGEEAPAAAGGAAPKMEELYD